MVRLDKGIFFVFGNALIRCPTDKSYLLAYHPNNDYYLPYIQVKDRSWAEGCRNLTTKYTREEILPNNLIRINRIWQCDNLPYLLNAVFEFIIPIEYKIKLKLPDVISSTKEKVMWMKVNEIQRLLQLEMLSSSELKVYFSLATGDQEVKIPKEIADFTGNIVLEVTKGHVMAPRSLHMNDSLVQTLALSENDVIILYKEFLKVCFPNIMMSLKFFRKLCHKMMWPDNMVTSLFRMGDVWERKALVFREVMTIMAVMEPELVYTGIAAEARCRLIFRYFDADKDGKLNATEFKNLMIAMRETKRSMVSASTLEKEVEKGYQLNFHLSLFSCRELSLAVGSEVALKDFVLQIGLLKFRGTSLIVKANSSIKDFIKACTAAGNQGEIIPGILRDLGEYSLAWHTVKVGKAGVKEVTAIIRTDGLFAVPPKASLKTGSEHSLNVFNASSVENMALINLKIYTQLLSQKVPTNIEYKKIMASLPSQLIQLCKLVAKLFGTEPRMLRVDSPVFILGDLHGNFPDICCFERIFWGLGIHLTPIRMLLLGDYVDRGSYGVELIAYLFAQKVRNPKKIFLVRGNHELREIQKNFTFQTECVRKFGEEQGLAIWQEINRAFDYMPLAAVVDDKIFCCHGGIPAPWLCPHVEFINKVPCPLANPDEESSLAWDLLWNDPVREGNLEESLLEELQENEGFAVNRRRGTAHVFDSGALNRFLAVNRMTYLIRAHEVQQAGVQIQMNGKMLTVFSSSYYNGGHNDAACVLVFEKKLRIFRLDTSEFHKIRD
ncbi:uncharacterized protein [Rhodnius prolixus]